MKDLLNLVLLHLVYLVLATIVVGAVICRVTEMHPKRNKRSWFFMYLAYVVFVGAALIDVYVSKQWQPVYLLGMLAMAMNLLVTWKSWVKGSPASSCRPGCAP